MLDRPHLLLGGVSYFTLLECFTLQIINLLLPIFINMRIIITESKETKLKEILEYLINVQVKDILSNSDYSERFSWDEQNAIASIDGVEINHMTYIDGIKVWIDIYGYDDTFDFDFLTSEIQYRLRKSFPHLKIFTNEVIMQDN